MREIDDIIRNYILKKCGEVKIMYARDFKCNNCHACCSNEGAVSLSISDIYKAAKKLDLTPKEFFDKYCCFEPTVCEAGSKEITYPHFALDIKDGCPFRNEKGCAIQEVKPVICKLYPMLVAYYIRGDIALYNPEFYPTCAVKSIEPTTYIVPDIDLLIDHYIGRDAVLSYSEKMGYKEVFEPRIVEGFYRREFMQSKNKNIRIERGKDIINEIMSSIEDMHKMDEKGLKYSDVMDKIMSKRKR